MSYHGELDLPQLEPCREMQGDHAQLGSEANALDVVGEERARARGRSSVARAVAALGTLRLAADVRDERGGDATGGLDDPGDHFGLLDDVGVVVGAAVRLHPPLARGVVERAVAWAALGAAAEDHAPVLLLGVTEGVQVAHGGRLAALGSGALARRARLLERRGANLSLERRCWKWR